VTRSLRWFNVSSPGSSPCWLDHCVSTPCDLITAVDPVDHCNGSTLVLLVLRPTGLITAFQHHVIRSLRRFHVESRGSSPCWLVHCVSTPYDSITAAVPRWFSWFFALLARSLRFNTMWLDHCGGSTLDLPVLRPAGSIIAFQHHVTRSLRRFHVGSPGSLP
jgi:hypothetical protein